MSMSAARLLFYVLIIILFAYVVVEARDMVWLAGMFPLVAGASGLIASVAGLIVRLPTETRAIRAKRTAVESSGEPSRGDPAGTQAAEDRPRILDIAFEGNLALSAFYLGLCLVFVVLVWVVGFIPAAMLSLVVFLWKDAKTKLIFAVGQAAVFGGALYAAGVLLSLRWPDSLVGL